MLKDFITLVWIAVSIIPSTIIMLVKATVPSGSLSRANATTALTNFILDMFKEEKPAPVRKPRAKKKP